jgi:histidine triad (HIT) family protein
VARVRRLAGEVLFRAARTRLVGRIVGWGFARMSSLLPVERLYESDAVLAFYHPRPAYPLHILIVPKRAVPNLLALSAQQAGLLHEVIVAAQRLVMQLDLERRGYRLIVNGGPYQDVPQLHFHLVSGA